jgi:hypothetical protein
MTKDVDGSAASDCSFAVGNEAVFVFVRQCHITHAMETKVFSGLETAMDWCYQQWKIPHREWTKYLYTDGVAVGWTCWMTESDLLLIHRECIVSVK